MGRILEMDIETYSDVDLIKCGVYAYADSPAFEVLLFAYSFDGEETKVIDLAQGEQLPAEVESAIFDESVIKTAFNANFERTCLSKYFGRQISPKSWHCSAVQAAMLALPRSLEDVGAVLGLEKQKMKEGKDLIRYFCVPCKSTKSNGGRTRNLPCHAPEKWELFKTYCKRDVDVEKAIRYKLRKFPIPESEMEVYRLDQEINDRGVLVDKKLVERAVVGDLLHKEIVTKRAYELTGLENPNSVAQIKGWLEEKGLEVDSLSKQAVTELIQESDGEVEELLKLRLLMAKTSVKKYEAIERSVCSDGRVHGLLQFYGANRTGRWAGRLVQVQNLPQNHIVDLELARNLVKQGRFEDVELLYDSTPKVLSELIRTAFIPKSGCRFLVADFSAIEARVLAWLAGEQWRLEVFSSHGKIYEASASAMFHVPIEEIKKGSPLRQKGKIAELALGYGGSVGALTSMGALNMGLVEEELAPLVSTWRSANPHITQFWWDVDAAAIKAVTEKQQTRVGKISFEYKSGILFAMLPSGRKLAYVKPRMALNKFDRNGLTYEGIGENGKWGRIETYGPKLVENIVQGTARDLLAEAMLRLKHRGFDIVMHIHDEAVLEVPEGISSVEEVCAIMAEQPEWAKGLPLRADGYECAFYKKD
ncbi:DNA polymerase [Frisingicoccus sp.]|uniref:DNA polymerase n=1 Tax=Frisingicoccus sp. TaxID=1918627 RepID=UPI003AB8B8FF